jgi:hypothetical protein
MTLHQPDLAAMPPQLADHLRGIAAAPRIFGRFPGLELIADDPKTPRAILEKRWLIWQRVSPRRWKIAALSESDWKLCGPSWLGAALLASSCP